MCEFHDSNGNGFGDIWWTDKLFYFSSILEGARATTGLCVDVGSGVMI